MCRFLSHVLQIFKRYSIETIAAAIAHTCRCKFRNNIGEVIYFSFEMMWSSELVQGIFIENFRSNLD